MQSTIGQRIEQARNLRYAIKQEYDAGKKHGEVRFKSIIECVDLIDEILGGRTSPDEKQIVALMITTIEQLERQMGLGHLQRAEATSILWDFLRQANKLSDTPT